MTRPVLVLATGNAKKVVEVQGYLPALEVRSLADHPSIAMPPEDGETFEENAAAKALHVARALGLPVLADDSGLEVDALGGAPGVRSARYAEGSDRDRVVKLLGALEGVPPAARGARFVCALALATPDGRVERVRGTVEGSILAEARGEGGFGYDPVFLVGGGGRTMAELTLAEKNAISHRGRALAAMRPLLGAYFSLEQPEPDRPAS
jgi:XTP/dITP diphosphohydrolase